MTASLLDHDALIAACTFSWNGFTTNARPWMFDDDRVNTWIEGSITFEADKVGYFQRGAWDTQSGITAMHKNIELSEARGHGFATAFHEHCVAEYRKLGAVAITLRPTDVGGYLWAKLGFSFGGDDTGQRRAAHSWWRGYGAKRAADLLADGRLDQRGHDELAAAFAQIRTNETLRVLQPHEVVRIGTGHAWSESASRMWVGKRLLLDSEWSGRLRL